MFLHVDPTDTVSQVKTKLADIVQQVRCRECTQGCERLGLPATKRAPLVWSELLPAHSYVRQQSLLHIHALCP